MENNIIDKIKEDIREEKDLTIEKLLNRLGESTTPLIEKKEEGYNLIFLYQEKELDNIAVVGSFPGFDLRKQKLTRIENTDFWYRTFGLKEPINFTYGFIKNFDEEDHELNIMANLDKDPFNVNDMIINQQKDQYVELSTFTMIFDQEVDQYFNRTFQSNLKINQKYLVSNIYDKKRRYWVLENNSNQKYEGIFLCTDGYTFAQDKELMNVFNTLRDENIIPNFLFIFVENEDRGIELAADQTFKNFLYQELLENVKKEYNINLKDKENIICGKSLGGLTSFYTAYDSDIFNNIISHSGTFIWGYPDERDRDFLLEEIKQSDFKADKVYLDVGILEDEFVPMWFMSLIEVNKRMKEILTDRTDKLYFNLFNGGHDYYCWRKNTVKGLLKFYK